MEYRNGNRKQMMLLPPTIESYVIKSDPVRAYGVFCKSIKLSATDTDYILINLIFIW